MAQSQFVEEELEKKYIPNLIIQSMHFAYHDVTFILRWPNITQNWF